MKGDDSQKENENVCDRSIDRKCLSQRSIDEVIKTKKHHAAKSDLEVNEHPGMEFRSAVWDGYQVSFTTITGEAPPASVFQGLPDNMCQTPHWGYVFKGKIVLKYKDREETISAGDAYYMEPGHVPIFLEKKTEWLEFSPKEEMDKTMAVIMENMKKMAAKKPE